MIIRFFIYGMLGWTMEIFWTGFNSFLKDDYKLVANTSLWMFPIYGLAIFLEPVFNLMVNLHILIRGVVYMFCIFGAEYITGTGIIKIIGACPWDYSDSPFNINSVIRLDYAPIWFLVGLGFEKLYFFLINF